ncbi:unnamed protein product, partial [Caenorhabditis brenneri]
VAVCHEEQYQMTVELLTFLAKFQQHWIVVGIRMGWRTRSSAFVARSSNAVSTTSINTLLDRIRDNYSKGFLLANGTNTDDFLGTCIYFFTDRTDRWQQYLS